MKPIRLETTSVDGTKINLEALYQIAPSCFTEEKDKETGEIKRVVNFETLRQLLGGDAVDEDEEMYQFTWPGKRAARYEAAEPIDDTLRPVPADSVDWDTTENLYIEGDNLRVLKLLQRGYMGKVKMIYIDPPYNTGNDFVYHDDFAHSAEEEDLAAGNIDEEGYRYRRNLDSNGRFHSDWCSMMYSRLLVAHSLLKEDGVIFISIDDNEVHNLRKICDEVFGEKNFVAEVSWHRNYASANDAKTFSNVLDYIIIYRKEEEFKRNLLPRTEKQNHLYKYDSNDGKGKWRSDNLSVRTYSAAYDFPIINPNTGVSYIPPKGRSWMTNKETIKLWIDEGRIFFGQKGDGAPQLKRYLSEVQDGVVPITYWSYDECGHNDEARKEIKVLFDGQPPFDSPKPTRLLLQALRIGTSPDSLILDFFSGSATTAHAVMQLNAEDGGKRKYICVQLPEETPEGSEARKAGYDTICEIGKERIRRAGKKIKEESPLTTQDLDTGFRVFRIDSGNYKDVTMQPNEYNQQMLDLFVDNIKADRTDLDLLFGAMLAWGVQLSLPMTTEEVDGCKIYAVDGNGLVACFAENISENVVQAMAAKQPLRVLFRDSCFDEDKTKINIFERFKQQLDWDEKEAIQNIRVV
ncbi:site-specific DNA-methyltransferase [Prevotella scopos JCM 17725]|uniref:site-specific DNA-methyltransferase (adenine-specific) n=1 Tax=Prevotella scopos JCM 17725 TaxID=1236518 RepID=A0AAX2F315_9BACT|nr:site-specific DNA-methyltransferase [Prevotella scopos]ANR73784.1 DNA methyltransferase [Prevotella scopos JCM 17725]QUB44376.1 site-specific DNA-methyltransferase [Prevotella scopos JCM 17725]SHF74792.1 adenine-specific DNA-methyltransferase [Prevotella scopos JCM 17725]